MFQVSFAFYILIGYIQDWFFGGVKSARLLENFIYNISIGNSTPG